MPDTILAAFRVTGVHPFLRKAITEAQMKPSLTTLTKGSFPLPQPSPVRAVMAAFNVNPPTAFATSPSTHISHHPAQIADVENLLPVTPTCRRRDPDIDPSLFTPSKQMQTLYATLSSTVSGSFLVSKTRLTSLTPVIAPVIKAVPSIPHPDWSLAYKSPADGIIEGSNATMVIQDMHLRKLNGALHGKETGRTSTRTLVVDASKGQIYLGDAIRAGIFEQEERKKERAAAKRLKADGRAAKKEAQAKVEEKWKRIKILHNEADKVWKGECDRLASEGVPKKKWPKGPTCPRKPKLPATLDAVVDEDNGKDDEEDDE
ncbi:hypothetical protein B0H34DRAFT_799403 [Crassisporium funariophilum]|nr:hypothetical protein B0H34DRAFT_799403 [Crassisporium funariophilum]